MSRSKRSMYQPTAVGPAGRAVPTRGSTPSSCYELRPRSDFAGVGVERLCAGEINAFFVTDCVQRSTASAGNVVKALRALFGFLCFQRYADVCVVDCVPKAVSWRETGRSRALEPDQARRLLASCARRSAAGLRDFAIAARRLGGGKKRPH